jgi:hypothetical protein
MLKKYFILSTLFVVGIFGFAFRAQAEKIESFDVSAEIGKDGTVNVVEYIKYDFEGVERHGIYRNIPLVSKDGPKIAIEVLRVSDEAGDVPFTVSRSNGELIIRIGDAERLVSGIQSYNIEYQVFGSIRFFKEYDEFYWNATGNDWQVPILSASAEVFADFGFLSATSSSCYVGPTGSVSMDCALAIADDGKAIVFSADKKLTAKEGLTFSVLFPKGEIDQALSEKGFEDNDDSISVIWFLIIFIPFTSAFIALFSWVVILSTKKLIGDRRLKGRPIVVQYIPPENISVTDMAFVGHRSFRAADISPVIIKLAMDGYIKIIYPKNDFFTRNNYELVKAKKGDDTEDGAIKRIFEYLFSESKDVVKINDLNRKEGSKLLGDLGVLISDDLLARGIFEKKNWLSTKLSATGLDILWKLFGFERFLSATEKEKLELVNAPELGPKIFEKFLPYAMVLGVEKKWAKKFEGIFIAPPSWVEGYPTNRPFSTLMFVNTINSFSSSVASHSTYSSGGGGGGSSGGGSGGGGGGSW